MDKQRAADRMSTTADTGNIRCPFFYAHGGRDLECEQIIWTAKVDIHRFPTYFDRKAHERIYCEMNYKYCEYYLALMEYKYKDD